MNINLLYPRIIHAGGLQRGLLISFYQSQFRQFCVRNAAISAKYGPDASLLISIFLDVIMDHHVLDRESIT